MWDEADLNYKQVGNGVTGEGDGDEFGAYVDPLAVGGGRNDDGGEDSGHVKVYKLEDSTLIYY